MDSYHDEYVTIYTPNKNTNNDYQINNNSGNTKMLIFDVCIMTSVSMLGIIIIVLIAGYPLGWY